MVDKVKNSKGGKLAEEIIEFVFIGAILAAALKVASQPEVTTKIGKLPVWQFVAGVLIASVVYVIHKNRVK